ncbi:MAG: hypothetical protein U1F50_09325 [Rubrivivax sp.]
MTQRAPLTVMDERVAALDPQTLETCLRCALERSETLVVIAHLQGARPMARCRQVDGPFGRWRPRRRRRPCRP